MRQFDVTRYPAIARQVGVVEHVVVEPVSRQDVALVVGLVERPVVAQALGRQHQHAVVAQFVILDDGQGFEGFAQTHAVGDDAATKAVQLVDGAHHTVALELEELFPHHGIADAGGGLDNTLLVHLVTAVTKQVMQHHGVDGEGVTVLAQGLQCFKHGFAPFALTLGVGCSNTLQACPLVIEPLGELRGFVGRF